MASSNDLRERVDVSVMLASPAQGPLLIEGARQAFEAARDADAWTGYFNRMRVGDQAGLSFHFPQAAHGQRFLQALTQQASFVESGLRAVPMIHQPAHEYEQVLGGPQAQPLYERYCQDSMPILYRWIAATEQAPQALLSLAADLLVLQMFALRARLTTLTGQPDNDPYPAGFVSYRSHAEGFFILSRDAAHSRQLLEQRYAKVAGKFREKLHRFSSVHDVAQCPAHLQEWLALALRTVEQVHDGLAERRLSTAAGSADAGMHGKDLSRSKLHKRLYKSRDFLRYMTEDPGFGAMRVLLGLTYLTLFRLGLPLVERYYLCYAISRAVEDEFGIEVDHAIARSLRRVRRSYLEPWHFWKWHLYLDLRR